MNKIINKPIVMIDFETTGLNPANGDRVTEVAALRIVDGEVVARFVSLINCNVYIPTFITQLTGITQKMVNGAPPAKEVIPELLQFIGTDTLSAHRASFDEKFLNAESQLLGLQTQHQGLICTVKLARRVFPGLRQYALSPLASTLGIPFKSQAHRAEADAEVASALLIHTTSHLAEKHNMASIDPLLLQKITSVSVAKVPAYLEKYFATSENS
jgi:DNA polymerase-3 subunit epsilon